MAGGRVDSAVDERVKGEGGGGDGAEESGGGGGPAAKLLREMFASCSSDPRGAVHRTWGVALIVIAVFCVASIIEVVGLSNHGGPIALAIAAALCGLSQLASSVIGTFVLKRFPTRFSVGFFLGLVVVLSQQCLLTFAAFYGTHGGRKVKNDDGSVATEGGRSSRAFANLSLALFVVYVPFALMLVHFREHVLLAPVDAEKFVRRGKQGGGRGGGGDAGSVDEGASYTDFGER